MSEHSSIEWTDTTWNPVTGCRKVSEGCDNCYAKTFAERWRGIPGHPFEQGFDVRLWPDRLTLPLRWRKPRKIFVNSMSDLFIDAEDRAQVKESDFGTVPGKIEDDDNDGCLRPLTAEERADWQADIRADYDTWMAQHSLPEPLVVHLSVPVVTRLRDRLSRKGPAEQGGAA